MDWTCFRWLISHSEDSPHWSNHHNFVSRLRVFRQLANLDTNSKQLLLLISNVFGKSLGFLMIFCSCFSYLLSFLTLYHVSPRSAFIARMSPLGMVILNSFPKASFYSGSLSSLPIVHNSSFNWVPAALPLTAVLVSATTFDLCLAVFLVTSSVVFLALVLFTNSKGWKWILIFCFENECLNF